MNFVASAQGTSGNDEITAHAGEIVDGAAGDDLIRGATGATMRGGLGFDKLVFSAKGYLESITLDVATQRLGDVALQPGTFISGFEKFEFTFGNGDDALDIRGATFGKDYKSGSYFSGSAGKDTVFIDHLTTGFASIQGFEVLQADFSKLNTAVTWNGSTIEFGDFSGILWNVKSMFIKGGSGNDVFTNTNLGGAVEIYGGAGNDRMGWASNEDPHKNTIFDGGPGNDIISGYLSTTVRGGAGIDHIGLSLDTVRTNIYFKVSSQLSSEITLPNSTKISGFEHFSMAFGRGDDTLDVRGMNLSPTFYIGGQKENAQSMFGGGYGVDTIVIDSKTRGSFSLMDFELLRANFSDVKSDISVENGGTIRFSGFIFDGGIFNSVDIVAGSGQDNLDGSWKNDRLNGGAGNDYITGMNGDDVLIGGLGRDVLEGGSGNDTYILDKYDRIYENTDDGVDTVKIGISYALQDGFENLTLLGRANINATGNALRNVIIGNSGDNIIDGMENKDTMDGQGGNDTYYVDSAGDIIVEAKGNGFDRVIASVSYTLSAGVEAESLYASAESPTKKINLTGNEFAQKLFGNAAANVINGGAGKDWIDGGKGSDTLIGGRDADSFVFNKGYGQDRVEDFENNVDNIDLRSYDFSSIKSVIGKAVQVGDDVHIKLGGADIIMLSDFKLKDLDARDFLI